MILRAGKKVKELFSDLFVVGISIPKKRLKLQCYAGKVLSTLIEELVEMGSSPIF